MKQLLHKITAFTGLLIMGLSPASHAQVTQFNGNFADLLGARLTVISPASISGAKITTNSFDGTGGWGGQVTPLQNVLVIKAVDSLGCTPITNGAAISGNFALIFRGDCEFGAKALAAQNVGAIGVIIVNNIPGEPVGMGAGAVGSQVTIPVFMVSQADGNAMAQQLNWGIPVVISTATWGFGLNHDLALVPNSLPLPHAMAIPYTQLVTGNGNPSQYDNYIGGFVANVGISTENTVRIKSQFVFTPSAGAPTTWINDSVTVGSIAPTDSVAGIFKNTAYHPHASGPGTLDVNYSVTSADVEDEPSDNSLHYTALVTDSIFSKGRYDLAKGEPIVTLARGTSADILWGPLYYVARGNGLRLDKLQFTISDGNPDTNATLDGHSTTSLFVFKWKDLNADGIIQTGDTDLGGELVFKGVGTKEYTNMDTSFNIFTVDVTDADGYHNVMLEDDATYWILPEVVASEFVGVDNSVNFTPREIAAKSSSNATLEYSAPIFGGGFTDIRTNIFDATMLPFQGGSQDPDSSYLPDAQGLLPNIAMHVTTHLTAAGVSNAANTIANLGIYPNPASDVLNVDVNFTKTVKNADFKVVSAIGQVVQTQHRSNITADKLNFPLKSLAAGHYYMVVVTDGGATIVRNFVIAK